MDSIQASHHVIGHSRWFNSVYISTTDSASAYNLSSISFVSTVNYIGKNDFPSARTAGISSSEEIDYGYATIGIEQMNGQFLHENGYLGTGITIAVLDAGFINVNNMQLFDSLRNDGRLLAEKNFVIPGNNVYGMSDHGTQVLSVLAGYQDTVYVGAAPKANYLLLLTEDDRQENIIEEYLWVMAAEYADSVGVDMINSSLGYIDFQTGNNNHTENDYGKTSTPINQAAKIASDKGILVVTSAGNEGTSSWGKLTFPSDQIEVLTVGSVDKEGNPSDFSGFTQTALSYVKPNVSAHGEDIYTSSSNNNYNENNGTSFATPLVCGLTACLLEALPGVPNSSIIEIIEQSAHLYSNPHVQMGYGIPDFSSTIEHIARINSEGESPFSIVPNPNRGEFTLTMNFTDSIEDVSIYDLTGKELLKIVLESPFQKVFNVKFYETGLHVVRIKTNKAVFAEKLFVE